MRVGRAFLLLPLVAAAPAAGQRPRAVVVVPGQVTEVVSDTMGTPYTVPFPARRVFQALVAVYRELKVPLATEDSLSLRVASAAFHRSSTFAGGQISTWLGCGDGASGPNADSYRVHMILHSSVEADGPDRARIRTAYLAGAVGQSGHAAQPMPCESTGRLEIRIHRMVLKAVAVP